MLEVVCPGCGNVLQVEERYAGHTGRCNLCNTPLRVPVPEPAGIENQYVAPESFGHYSKAKEERWEDPMDKAEDEPDLGEIPEEILRKYKARQLKRQRTIMKWASIAAMIVLVIVAVLLYGLLKLEMRPEKPAPPVEVVQPPATQVQPPPTPPTPANVQVHAVESDWRYHRATCQIFLSGAGAKHSGTVAQAVTAGYKRCEYCNPPLDAGGASPFLPPPNSQPPPPAP